MSVTVYVEETPSTVAGYTLDCGCGRARAANEYRTRESAYEASRRTTTADLGCVDEDCCAYGDVFVAVLADTSVNMCNGNATHVMGTLGYTDDDLFVGSAAGADFMGRVLMAQGLLEPDAGVAATQDGNWIECGRPTGYTDERLAQLWKVAKAAVDGGASVLWG